MPLRFAAVAFLVVSLAAEVAVAQVAQGDWSAADRASLQAGVQAVPPAVRALVGEVRFVRAPRECPFAMGAYNKSCPTFATVDGRRTFFVYDGVQAHGDGPPTRLRGLNAVELRDVLVRRAVVHAYFAELDRARRWSEEPRWQRVNFWRGGDRPFNRDPWGFSRYLGMRSARLDLVTFAEEYFVSPDDVLATSAAPDAPQRLAARDADLDVRCQAFTKSRFLTERVRSLDPQWRARNALACKVFDAWASLDTLDGIDILFAAATADRPQSLWGHLLIHVRHSDRADGFEPVYQFGAVIADNTNPVDYLTRGLMGGFYTVLDPSNFRDIDREFMQTEQRSLKRYRLSLTREQSRSVLERVWEMERRSRLPYWFLDENCAAFVQDLLVAALDDVPLSARSDFVVAPTDVLDAAASVTNPSTGAPLLVKLPDEELSNRERARWALSRRDTLLRRLEVGAPAIADVIKGVRRRLDSRDAEERAAAYRELGEALATHAAGADASHVLAYNVMIERFYVEAHVARANAVWDRLRVDDVSRSVDERLARRRELYVHEDAERRAAQRHDDRVTAIEQFAEAARRDPKPAEQRALMAQDIAREALTVAVRAYRQYAQAAGDHDPQQIAAVDEAARVAAQHERDLRSIGPSGKGRVAAGVAAAARGAEVGARLRVDVAFLREELGAQRRRGFRPDIETQVMALSLLTPLPGAPVAQLEADVVLLRYLTIEQSPRPARRGWLDGVGYGFDLSLHRSPRLGSEWGVAASAGLLLPLLASDSMTSFLVLGGFPVIGWEIGRSRDAAPAGARLFARMQLHLFGNFANVLRGRVEVRPFVDVIGLVAGVSATAEVQAQLVLGSVGGRPIFLTPHARVDHTTLWSDPTLATTAGVRIESAL